jgi:hypothetical protein
MRHMGGFRAGRIERRLDAGAAAEKDRQENEVKTSQRWPLCEFDAR